LKNIVIIGKVIDAYGIKGWVKVRSFTETPKNFTQYINQFISANQKDWETITIKDMKVQGENVLIDLGYLDRNEAIKRKGSFLAISRDQLPTLNKDEFYWEDLIGLNVIDQQNVKLGIVTRLIETGANDVLIVKGERERLIPYIPQVILEVNLQENYIKVEWDKDF
jgi:16S rRNA processing protein RimM